MEITEKIIDLLKKDEVIPVLGAGVSYATSKIPGWEGFIKQGLEFIKERNLAEEITIEETKKMLDEGDYLQSAEIMKQILNAPYHPFSDWLDNMLHEPDIHSNKLIESIRDLIAPIVLTTNYDKLFYYKYHLNSYNIFNWTNHRLIKRSINKKDDIFLHLHGIYDEPETVILSQKDYSKLNENEGYKNIISELWSNRSFIFIGCSKNGVLDEDFKTVLNFFEKWFPDLPREHYILLKNDEIVLCAKELSRYNIIPVAYGEKHDDLPLFINKLNPNQDKKTQKLNQLLNEIKADFDKQLINERGELTQNQSKLTSFLQKFLPYGVFWMDSLQFATLENVFNSYNQSIQSKKEQFRSIQMYVNALIEVSKLNYYIELWNSNWGNPQVFEKTDFILYATLANEYIKKFPKEVLNDIRLKKPYVIHNYYFDGYLQGFIERYKLIQENDLFNESEYFKDDAYFFENLKRLIDSLKGILEIDAEELYQVIEPAIITSEIIKPSFLFVSSSEISLRKFTFPFDTYASVKAENGLSFVYAELMSFLDKEIIIGFNSLGVFYWNPIENLNINYFYKSSLKSSFRTVKNLQKNISEELLILEGNEILIFQNFSIKEKIKLEIHPEDIIYFSEKKRWIFSKNLGSFGKGNIVFMYDYDSKKSTVLLSTGNLWSLLYEIDIIKSWINSQNEKDTFFHSLRSIQLFNCNQDKIFLKVSADINDKFFCVLFYFKIDNDKITILKTICIPDILTITFDTNDEHKKTNLLLGLLDINSLDTPYSTIYLNDMDNTTYWNGLIDATGNAENDILYVKSFNERENFAAKSKEISFLNFESKEIKTIQIENVKYISQINN